MREGEEKTMPANIHPSGNFSKQELSTPGNVTAGLMQHLAERFTPELIADKIAELLHATHVTSGNRTIADNRAREAGLKLLLGYLIGLPVQRQEIFTRHTTTLDELKAQAKGPELRAAIMELLDEKPVTGKPVNTQEPNNKQDAT